MASELAKPRRPSTSKATWDSTAWVSSSVEAHSHRNSGGWDGPHPAPAAAAIVFVAREGCRRTWSAIARPMGWAGSVEIKSGSASSEGKGRDRERARPAVMLVDGLPYMLTELLLLLLVEAAGIFPRNCSNNSWIVHSCEETSSYPSESLLSAVWTECSDRKL